MSTESVALLRNRQSGTEEHPAAYTVAVETGNQSLPYRLIKRAFDIVASAAAGVVLFVPMMLVAGAIRLDSPGSALFRQERLGRDGKPFMMIKFRTMHLNAEVAGPQWAAAEDERCTRVGRVLRKTRIDELPQLWNIFCGHMSVVGPRPERAYFYDEFEAYIHGFRNRLAVRPGLTGLAQVNGGYELKPEEKIVYDMEYIRTQSLWVDIKCMVKTVRLVFTHEGAR